MHFLYQSAGRTIDTSASATAYLSPYEGYTLIWWKVIPEGESGNYFEFPEMSTHSPTFSDSGWAQVSLTSNAADTPAGSWVRFGVEYLMFHKETGSVKRFTKYFFWSVCQGTKPSSNNRWPSTSLPYSPTMTYLGEKVPG